VFTNRVLPATSRFAAGGDEGGGTRIAKHRRTAPPAATTWSPRIWAGLPAFNLTQLF